MSHSSTHSTSSSREVAPQTWAEIDLDAIARNVERVAAKLHPSTNIMLAVKKSAYGHGLVEVSRKVQDDPRVTTLGVATLDEALELRQAGIEMPILLLSIIHGEELRLAIEHDVAVAITCTAEANEASQIAGGANSTAQVHVKVDTGMGRLGKIADGVAAALAGVRELPHLEIGGIYTHLPNGWTDPDSARRQREELARIATDLGLEGVPLHLGGSDALSLGPDPGLAAMRIGISAYGYHPAVADLEPAMTLKSRVVYRKRAKAGARISYEGTHALERDSELAVIGAGYGNGYPRSLSNRGEVLIRGERYRILGTVCMDQVIVDVTDRPEIAVGEEAVLFGRQGEAVLGADEMAGRGGTIAYELLTSAGQICPRVYA